ncbi:hypothetical protein [Pseudoalteromonas umbrosa]|uniref:hypothetical protein n=1 Tax=Pseudoalteromonas umbrosa TaxID=3048489 RepID=UPI0024C24355|nr:hypothetical protein [Pseudoalteromonas sp. B95]MDK1285959.1 hypothetical protein [Pseudoalteromonas sp. B95]
MDSSTLLSILDKAPEYSGVIIVFALLPVVVKTVSSLIDFYENVHLTRFFNRVKYLSEHAPSESEASTYLESLKCNEIFRLTSGIRAYPEKSKMLMKIFEMGIADNRELRGIQRYLFPSNTKVRASINTLEKLHIIYSGIFGVILMVSGIVSAVYFQFGELGESVAGIVIMFFLIFFGGIAFKDYQKYMVLKRVSKKLCEFELYAEQESNIDLWSFRNAKSAELGEKLE